jgi:hypothetical protein
MKTRSALLAATLTVIASLAESAPLILVADAGGPLHTVDAATGAVTNLGSPSVIMTDIAFSPTGLLYGISDNNLYRINQSLIGTVTSTTLIGSMGLSTDTPASMVFGADGTLYTAGTSLYTLSTSTGQATLVGNGGYTYGSNGFTGDLAFIGSELYLTSASVDFGAGFAYEDLVKLDTGSGAGTLVGHIGSRDINTGEVTGFLTVWGLATPDHVNLYGVAGTQVISIDPATGAGTLLVGNYAQPPFAFLNGAHGAAIGSEASAVPAPAAAWLVAPALAALAPRFRRRKAH